MPQRATRFVAASALTFVTIAVAVDATVATHVAIDTIPVPRAPASRTISTNQQTLNVTDHATIVTASLPETLANVTLPAFTSFWRLARARPIPVEASNALPFVVACDDDARLWIADQRRHSVKAYNSSGARAAVVSVPSRGIVTAIDFDNNNRILFANQRGELGYPIGELRVHTGARVLGKDYALIFKRTYPKYWVSGTLSDALEAARTRGEYAEATLPTSITPRIAGMSPQGTLYVAVPLLALIERYSADGRTVSAVRLTDYRPLVLCWLLVTRGNELILGDALRQRIIIMDTRARVITSFDCPQVQSAVAAKRPDDGWILLQPDANTLTLFGVGGVVVEEYSLAGLDCGTLLMPNARTCWAFDTNHWRWLRYERIRR